MKLLAKYGSSKFYQGDAKHLDKIENGSVQLSCFSPPYFTARPEYATWNSYPAYLADMAGAVAETVRVLCEGGRIAVNVPLGYGRPSTGGYLPIGIDWTRLLQDAGLLLRGHIIWDKRAGTGASTAWGSWLSPSNPSLRDVAELIIVASKGSQRLPQQPGHIATITPADFLEATRNVWQVAPTRSWHPAPWPAELPRRLIQLYTYEGDVVLDQFSGSGTTVFEAEKSGRVGIAVDLKEEYVRKSVLPLFWVDDGGSNNE